jgi:ElaB/YqjD/DUF883 family membrane-anchored ribosome-binding protein
MATARKRKNGRNSADLQARLSLLREDIDALQDDMRGLVSDVGDVATDQAKAVVNGAMDTASETAERVTEWSSDNIEGVRQAVRTQPLAACVLSMSAGALIGALLLR